MMKNSNLLAVTIDQTLLTLEERQSLMFFQFRCGVAKNGATHYFSNQKDNELGYHLLDTELIKYKKGIVKIKGLEEFYAQFSIDDSLPAEIEIYKTSIDLQQKLILLSDKNFSLMKDYVSEYNTFCFEQADILIREKYIIDIAFLESMNLAEVKEYAKSKGVCIKNKNKAEIIKEIIKIYG